MKRTIIVTIGVLAIAAAFAWTVSQGSAAVGGLPVVVMGFIAAFAIQWIAFVPAVIGRTEKFFDLTGSATYLLVTALMVVLSPVRDARAILLMCVVAIWAVRLGTFLARRVHRAGKDERFDEIKADSGRFFTVWHIQGLWVSLTAMAAWVGITSTHRPAIGWLTWLGLALWAFGFAFEVTADLQKSRFRADPANKGRFIASGLWSVSRHPNYFGEIVLWCGVALMAAPTFQGWQWAALFSPVFVAVLLIFVSGIPLLEKRADERWGDDPDYQAYKSRTPVLVPFIG